MDSKSIVILTVIQFAVLSKSSAEEISGHFWQLADLHWDQQYTTNGDASKMCHTDSLSETNIGKYGTYGCDAPWDLVESSIQGMASNDATPDFIFWTGDNSPHTSEPDWPDWPVIFTALRNVSDTIQKYMPNVTIFPILGNHDVYPKDFYPSNSSELYNRYLTEGGWMNLLAPETQKSFAQCGYYSVEVKSNLTAIILNTNLYNPHDDLTIDESDPCEQLSWFESQLQRAESLDYKVMISAHIPPGYFERWPVQPLFYTEKNDRYIELIHDFGHVIAFQVYGHTHTDAFRIFADNSTEIQSVAFLAPSVTPWLPDGGVNPGLRLYQYSASGIEDYWQYYLNLSTTTQPMENSSTPEWQLLYQFTTTYQVPDVSADSLMSIHKRMLTAPEVFADYYTYNTVGHVFVDCDAVCTREHLCSVSHLKSSDMHRCLKGEHLLFRHDPELSSLFADISRRADVIAAKPSGLLIGCSIALILTCAIAIGLLYLRSASKRGIQKYLSRSERRINGF